MDSLSDNELMRKVKDGDFDKMSLLYERHYRQLFGYLFKMTKQKEASEDLVQNVFFRLLKYRKNFNGDGVFRAWMYHVARNVLHDHYQKAKRIPSNVDLHVFEGRMEEDILADEQIEKKQAVETLIKAMEQLSAENRELLILCRYQDLKHQEIARILNISEGAVKVRVHRAMNELKSIFLKMEN